MYVASVQCLINRYYGMYSQQASISRCQFITNHGRSEIAVLATQVQKSLEAREYGRSTTAVA